MFRPKGLLWEWPWPVRAVALLAIALVGLSISLMIFKPAVMKLWGAETVTVQATVPDLTIRASTTTASYKLGTMQQAVPVMARCRYKDQRVTTKDATRSSRIWIGLHRGGYVTAVYIRFKRGRLGQLPPCTDVPRVSGGATAAVAPDITSSGGAVAPKEPDVAVPG